MYKISEKRMAHLSTSSLNLIISRSIFQKYGFNIFFFCANKPDNPFLLPHSQPWPWSKLTENDISDNSISIPRLSKNSIIFGYVTCLWCRYSPSQLTLLIECNKNYYIAYIKNKRSSIVISYQAKSIILGYLGTHSNFKKQYQVWCMWIN